MGVECNGHCVLTRQNIPLLDPKCPVHGRNVRSVSDVSYLQQKELNCHDLTLKDLTKSELIRITHQPPQDILAAIIFNRKCDELELLKNEVEYRVKFTCHTGFLSSYPLAHHERDRCDCFLRRLNDLKRDLKNLAAVLPRAAEAMAELSFDAIEAHINRLYRHVFESYEVIGQSIG